MRGPLLYAVAWNTRGMADMGALNNTRPGSRSRGGLIGPAGVNPEVAHRDELEQARRELIERQRAYTDGTQYDIFNSERLASLCRDQQSPRTLPEHERVHAYATQIGESVGYLVSRLGAGFSLTADNADVQAVLDDVVAGCDVISTVDADGDVQASTDAPLHDAIVAGDVPVLVDWDEIEGRVALEFWESEAVEFVDDQRGGVERVILTYRVWQDNASGVPVETERRRVYSLDRNPAGVTEALVEVYEGAVGTVWADDEEPVEVEWLGVGVIPWALLRADRRGLRTFRGSSLVTKQVMETADRYNSVEQTGFIIARYNSHSNVAVSGDEVMARQLAGKNIVRKDVADVVTFPEGTDIEVLSLPTDPAMIDHQRAVLTDALYSAFGLVRMDPSALQGLGQVSGYALEIMNGRTDATFGRVARCWRKDWAGLIELILDVTAWRGEGRPVWLGTGSEVQGQMLEAPELDADPDDYATDSEAAAAVVAPVGFSPWWHWWDVDPEAVFPDRAVAIKLGSGAVVDDVKARDDFTAGLISRNEALRQRGKTPDQIAEINAEIQAQDAAVGAGTEAGAAGDYSAPAPGTVGGTLGNATRTDN